MVSWASTAALPASPRSTSPLARGTSFWRPTRAASAMTLADDSDHATVSSDLAVLTDLLRHRNEIDRQIAGLIGRPAERGHLGEFIASRLFGIRIAGSATQKDLDGWFESGPLAGKSVNVKLYGLHEGLL